MSVARRKRYKSEEDYLQNERKWKAKYRKATGSYQNIHLRRWEKWEDKIVLEHSITDRELSKKIHRSVSAIQIRRSRLLNGSV